MQGKSIQKIACDGIRTRDFQKGNVSDGIWTWDLLDYQKVWNISNYKREQRLKSLKIQEFWKSKNFESLRSLKS